MDCAYDEFRGCQKDSFLGYAVVSCFNGKLSNGKLINLSMYDLDNIDRFLIFEQSGLEVIKRFPTYNKSAAGTIKKI